MRMPSLAVLLAACSVTVHETTAWSRRAAYGVRDWTGREVVLVDSPAEADVVRAALRARCEAGEVRVELADPAGVVRYRETLRGGARESELLLAARAGRWRCSLDFRGFSGDWAAELTARSEPGLRISAEITGVEVR